MKPGKLNRKEGTILLVAIIVAGMGAFGIAAWVSLLQSRLGQSEAIEAAAMRRVRMENSRAAAREYVYQNVVTKNSGAQASISLPGGWGGIEADAWTGNPLASTALGTQISGSGSSPRQRSS